MQLEQVERELARLYAESDAVSGAALNPAGDIGGIRGRSPRQKEQLAVRRDRIAREIVALERERQHLLNKAASEERAAVAAQAQEIVTDRVRGAIKKGMRVTVAGFPNPGVVQRVNAKSVTVAFPSGYTERVRYDDVFPAGAGT